MTEHGVEEAGVDGEGREQAYATVELWDSWIEK